MKRGFLADSASGHATAAAVFPERHTLAGLWTAPSEPSAHSAGGRLTVSQAEHFKKNMYVRILLFIQKWKWSSFTHPLFVQNLFLSCFLSTVDGRLTSIVWKKIPWKSVATVNCLVTTILQNNLFCVQQKKDTHTGLEQVRVSKWWQKFHFGWSIPLKFNLQVYRYKQKLQQQKRLHLAND